jgi:(p)ppGpp synthase/HD superfamily hydrolase
MANKYMDSSLLDRAIIYAVKAHANTERRGKGFPYIVHPMEAMEIVATITPDQTILSAAALHDVVEDTDCTIEELRSEFGDKIADLVESESDKFTEGVSETDSWRDRKQAAIDRLAKAGRDSKIVALGDKLSNMRAIARDFDQIGNKLWERFHAPQPQDHEWHYRGLAASLSELSDTAAYQEFAGLIERVFTKAFHS